MYMIRLSLAVCCLALFVGAGAVIAAPKEKSAIGAEEKQSRSKECSAQADKQGLHGRERQKFRSKCKREGKT
jgi:psiF repeat